MLLNITQIEYRKYRFKMPYSTQPLNLKRFFKNKIFTKLFATNKYSIQITWLNSWNIEFLLCSDLCTELGSELCSAHKFGFGINFNSRKMPNLKKRSVTASTNIISILNWSFFRIFGFELWLKLEFWIRSFSEFLLFFCEVALLHQRSVIKYYPLGFLFIVVSVIANTLMHSWVGRRRVKRSHFKVPQIEFISVFESNSANLKDIVEIY